jgi:hypothetical protein
MYNGYWVYISSLFRVLSKETDLIIIFAWGCAEFS